MAEYYTPCLVRDCPEKPTHRGRCARHYRALRRTDPAVLASERDYKLRSRYGISADEANDLKASQDYTCHICGLPEEESPGGLAVDHDHITGVVRGALCTGCNLGIGHLVDSPQVLDATIAYLSRAQDLRRELAA